MTKAVHRSLPLTIMLPGLRGEPPVTSSDDLGPEDSESLSVTFKNLVLAECHLTPERASEQSPIHGLPAELIILVFSEVLRDYISAQIVPALHLFPRAPFMLAAVCSAWRDIMLQTPDLWTILIINLDAPSCPKKYAELLDLFLSRSRSARLDVSVICVRADHHSDELMDRARGLLVLLVSIGSRIQALAIRSTFDLLWTFTDAISFPHLTHLHFFVPTNEEFYEPSVPVFLWMTPNKLPSLINVRVEYGTGAGFMQGALGVSRQVTSWSLSSSKVSEVLEVLEAGADTIRVFMTSFRRPGDHTLSSPVPTLTQLRELYIDMTQSLSDPEERDPLPTFFQRLTSAPRLHTLFIEDYEEPPYPSRIWDRDAFKGFAERSNLASTLTQLSIRSTFITDEDTIQMLTLVPKVEFLVLNSSDETDGCVSTSSIHLIEYLLPLKDSNTVQVVLPNLQALQLSIRGSVDIPQRIYALARLAEVRSLPRGIMQKLNSLQLRVDDSLIDSAERDTSLHASLERLLRCRSLGLRINMRYENTSRVRIRVIGSFRRIPGDAQMFGADLADDVCITKARKWTDGFPF